MRSLLRTMSIFAVISVLGLQLVIAQVSGLATEMENIAKLGSDFDLLKTLGLISIGVAVAAGLALYAYRHRRLMQYDALIGLLLTVLLAPTLFYISTHFLGEDSRACFSMSVAIGENATEFDAACATARESAANMIGLKSAWRMIFGGAIINGLIAPLVAGAVQFLMYISVILGSAVLYLGIRPLLKRFG